MKKILQVLFFFTAQVLAQSPIISVSPETLNENLFMAKTSTQKLNISNNGNSDLIFNISTGFSTGGVYQNNALEFNGVDSYLSIKNGGGLNGATQGTIEFWVKWIGMQNPGSPINFGQVIARQSNGVFSNNIIGLSMADPTTAKITWSAFSAYETDIVGNTIIGDNQWHHIAVSFKPGEHKLYVDGNVDGSAILAGSMNDDPSVPLTVGAWIDDGNCFSKSVIDEVRIWNTVRTQSEIQENMFLQLTGSESGLIGYWNFNEGSGNTTDDKSLNANHGSLQGGVNWILSEIQIAPSWISASSDSGVCNPGSTSEIKVAFNAWGLRGGNYDADIVISSNDPVKPEITIPVYLSVTDAPAFSIDLDSIDFGEVFLGVTDTIHLEARNIGSQDLLIFGTSIQPTVYSVHPTFAGIDVGDTETFTITFLPQSVGAYNGRITFNNNDPTLNSYTIPISGIGIEPPIIAINPDSLVISVLPGTKKTKILTINNQGPSNLNFNIFGGFSSSNYALQFDGIDDMVQGSSIGFPIGNSNRTIELWFKRFGQPFEEGTIIAYGGWGWENADKNYSICIHQSDHWFFSQWGVAIMGNKLIQSNQWYHVAVVNVGNDVVLYLNGEVDRTGNLNINTLSNSSFYMGKAPTNYDSMRKLNGIIDEVRIWDVTRTQEEIREYMNQQLTGIEQNLIAYWQFDEGVGNSAKDKTENANNGILQGGVTWINSSAPMEPGWFTINADSGICSANSSMDIELLFDATELDTGDYYASLIIKNNDPTKPSVTIPIHMIVSTTVGIDGEDNMPRVFNLNQNYPNPFNPSTKISWQSPVSSWQTLKVYDILGNEVATLVDEEKPVGRYEVEFQSSISSLQLASGIYFYQLKAGSFTETKKMILLR